MDLLCFALLCFALLCLAVSCLTEENLTGNCLTCELIESHLDMHPTPITGKCAVCLNDLSYFQKITGFLSVILEIDGTRKISNLQPVELKSGGQCIEGVTHPDWAGNNPKVLVISHVAASH